MNSEAALVLLTVGSKKQNIVINSPFYINLKINKWINKLASVFQHIIVLTDKIGGM